VYLPFLQRLRRFHDAPKAIDLGCGRGEWLELLQESGIDALGVDLDDAMLAACRERGLKVQTHDAVEFLQGLADASQLVVSGFHIAEHLPFPDLQALVREALRVLQPGGLLILETPNPENIVVGTANFYLDPTHQRPIPPLLLSFLPEYYGYARVKILRLQESPQLASNRVPTSLLGVLSGVSPDYAVVAQKMAGAEILAATQDVFEANYGLTLEALAARYDQQTQARIAAAEARAAVAEARAAAAEARIEAWQTGRR
jgi:SAM-dependent methyltransferase